VRAAGSTGRLVIAGALAGLGGITCESGPSGAGGASARRNDLAAMPTVTIRVREHRFLAWVARTPAERELGLMNVRAEEMAPTADGLERAMLFVFDYEQPLYFWMKDTIIPLDIAFLRADGQVVKTHTMVPYETRLYPSVMPAAMAVEMNAGVLSRLGIGAGDVFEIPEGVLKPRQPSSE